MNFNPRTPYGMRPALSATSTNPVQFQSTHPLRDATRLSCLISSTLKISIHAPLTGCDCDLVNRLISQQSISIHAPLTGCDVRCWKMFKPTLQFQSTHPLRDATLSSSDNCDNFVDFNPRTPYGMRLETPFFVLFSLKFQSTHPLRDATH